MKNLSAEMYFFIRLYFFRFFIKNNETFCIAKHKLAERMLLPGFPSPPAIRKRKE